ncbi:MAG TPA: error-prone DNA polymerase [Candidatus Binataceae bacterium]|nr:error-prone DNA polymerase [Candidatus Binataceae bacterium]
MDASSYIELRARSAFSFLEGASTPEDLADRAAELGYPAIALGDRDGVYGHPRFHQAAKNAGLRAIVGADLTLEDDSRLYVLVPDRERYKNLCRMITASKCRVLGTSPPPRRNVEARMRADSLNSPPPRFPAGEVERRGRRSLPRDDGAARVGVQSKATNHDAEATPIYPAKGESRISFDDLERYGAGLICLAGGARSPISRALIRGEDPRPLADSLNAIFGARNLIVDLQRHLDADEERMTRKLRAFADACRIPLAVTNDVCHADADRRLMDVLSCIRLKKTLEEAGRALWVNAERRLKSPAEIAALFPDLPRAIAMTHEIADRCEFTLTDLGYRFPDYPLPPGETLDSYLRALTYAGARDRWGRALDDRTRHQLEHELAMIEKLKLAGYFLIVWDIVQFCRENQIMVQGRGSAANSAVCYALGITAVDAVKMDLLFERFLSEERGEWPDIDLDLPSGDQREKVIQYVYRRYGERGSAMTANAITYRTKSAVREVAKVLGFPPDQIDKLARLNQAYEFRDDHDDIAALLRRGGVDIAAPRIATMIDLVRRIQSVPRHLGQHSGGMVIAAGPLDEVVPLEPASMPGRVVIQWDKEDCADLGIIKIDLLGLGMLAVLEQAIPMIRVHEDIEIDLAHLPPDDPEVYAMLRCADTVGVFQVESRAQMATLPRMKPDKFYDLVVEVAIIRPGPIVGQMVNPYLERRNGRQRVTYSHPSLEPILKRTLGIPLFQEQVIKVAMTAAGLSGGEAEEVRRAMGFKRSVARMEKIERRLREGMKQKGILGEAAEEIVRSITSFALYGFPESHSASFALLAYASAYLKYHHTAAFFAAMLNCYPMGFYHPATLVKDAQHHGVTILPIDVTRSDWLCTLEPLNIPPRRLPAGRDSSFPPSHSDAGEVEGRGRRSFSRDDRAPRVGVQPNSAIPAAHPTMPARITNLALRLGLKYVTGLREDVGLRIAAERERHPFASLADFTARTAPNRRELAALSYSGSFAAFGMNRREALWQAAAIERDPRSLLAGVEPKRKTSSPLPAMTPMEETRADYSTMGLTAGPHLMAHLRERLNARGVLPAAEIANAADGAWVKTAGLVIVRQRPGTAKGFFFLTLEDETGISNAIVMPDLFQTHRVMLRGAAILLVEGVLQKRDGVVMIKGQRFEALRLQGALPPSHDFH